MKKMRGQVTPEQDALKHIIACKDKPFLIERFIDPFKKRGVFTCKTIKPSTFVLEYRGNIFSRGPSPEGRWGDILKGFLYEFSWKGERWCVDASKEDITLGRLVNDDHISPNCEMRKIVCEGEPHLCLFAVEEISPGEEITYSYGDSSYPWRSEKKTEADFNCDESCYDDDEEPGPSRAHCQNSSQNTELDSSQEVTEMSVQLSEEESSDKDYQPKHSKTSVTKNPGFTKQNYCYVCGKGNAKFARHLQLHADEEPEIAEAFSFPANSTERKRLLEKLRNRGNFQHNEEVLRSNTGVLKVRRRPKSDAMTEKRYKHCLYCKGMFQRSELWKHITSCAKKTSQSPTSVKTRVPHEISPEKSEFVQEIPPDVKKTLSTMKQDEVLLVIQNDYLLIQLARSLNKKFENNPSKQDYVRHKLREMGRFLLQLHKTVVLSFEEAIQPKNFLRVVRCMKNFVGFSDKSQTYIKPALAVKLGNSLKTIGNIVVSDDKSSDIMKSHARMFIEKCDREWSGVLCETKASSLSGQKVNSPSTIPFTRDVQEFYKYMERLSASSTESLKTGENPQVYNVLSRVTLAQVSVLSKCTTEVSEMTLKSFQERDNSTQVLSKHFIRINIQNKGDQNVAVLLTSQLISALTLLISKRLICGVHEDNPFLFAKPDSSATSHYHGGSCIKSFSSLCHAKNPEHLRSVHLLKHIARMFQILNLENDELEHLAKLLGHNIRADREYYRTAEAAVELAKIAKLLKEMEKGSLDKVTGNSLEEVEIEDELEPDVEQSRSGKGAESDLLLQHSEDSEQQSRQLTSVQDALEHIKTQRDKPFLQEKFIDSFKGRGVFTNESIEPSSFVVEFRGNICSREETHDKDCGDTLNDYQFDFSWNGTNMRIDASADDGTLGRLVNDDHINPNCKVMKIDYEGKPHVCLFAQKKISPGDEITFNYGNSSYSWRSKETSLDENISETDLKTSVPSPVNETVEDCPDSPSYSQSSGEEYVCDEEPDSDDTLSESEPPKEGSFIQQSDQIQQSSDDSGSDEESKRTSWTNKNFCYVCGKPQRKISRHLFTHRKAEPEIAEAFALPQNSKERKKLLQKLRSKGNYKHNEEVLKTRKGRLKAIKKRDSSSLEMSAACIYCKVLFSRRSLRKHLHICPSKISNPPTGSRTQILALVATGLTDPQHVSSGVRKILKRMRDDEVRSSVLKDSYLLQLAQCLYHMCESKCRDAEISRKLRLLVRLLSTLKERSIFSFEEALTPQNFNSVVEAVGKPKETNKRLVSTLVHLLKRMAEMKYANALNDRADKETIQEAEEFLKLFEKELSPSTPGAPKGPMPATLPFIHDVQLLFKHIDGVVTSAVKSLTMYESPPVYSALLRGTIAYVVILNRNVDTSHVTLQSFQQRNETELQKNTDGSQSQFEEILFKCTVKINVSNQKGQKVVLVLTPELLSAITLLVEKRKSCSVPENNPYLFAKPNTSNIAKGFHNITTFVHLCGAKGHASLVSPLFRKHLARIFQLLILGKDELGQLAGLLGRDIRTEKEFYQTPEAAADVAKILVLLSAVEIGCLEIFDGKSLEEIEIPDELQPVVEQNRRAEDEESETSLQVDGASPSKRSATKRKSRGSSAKNQNRGKKKRKREEENENEQIELNGNNVVSTEEATNSEEKVEKDSEKAAEQDAEPPSHSKEPESQIYFSDEDDDMNVDFNVDIDTDDDDARNETEADSSRSEGNQTDKNTTEESKDVSEKKDKDSSEEIIDTIRRNSVEGKDSGGEDDEEEAEQDDWMDEDSDDSSPLRTEKKDNLTVMLQKMKKIKILIPRLNIDKMETPVHISKLNLNNEQPGIEQPTCVNVNQSEKSREETNEPNTKAVQMSCSNCKKNMMKGATAYQKKGFTEVFCSKTCLFEMFPPKAAMRTCYYCFREISQPLDLIMAVVDLKGTMKDFCSTTCLCAFKSNPASMKTRQSLPNQFNTASTQTSTSLCSTCNKTCSITLDLNLGEAVHNFCSNVCLETFCREKVGICDNCSSTCRGKPLTLKLEGGTKTICGSQCLEEFKENVTAPIRCTLCHTSQPISNMFTHRTSQNFVALLCSQPCVTSYKLHLNILDSHQKKSNSTGSQPEQKSASDEGQKDSDSAVKEHRASPALEKDDVARLIVQVGDVACCSCHEKLMNGCKVYQLKRAKQLFCSASCVTKKHPHVQFDTRKCYNCSQLIMQPQKVILAPVDDSGTMRELCSDECLSSVKSKRLRAQCKLCTKYRLCKFSVNVDGEDHKVCSSSCITEFNKENQSAWFICEICCSLCSNERLVVKTGDDLKTICANECLVKFKEKVETRQLCPTCCTSHRLSDMVERRSDEGLLEFFCSDRCMKLHNVQSFTLSEKKESPSSEEIDVKEVKPLVQSLPHIKEEPVDEACTPDRSDSVSSLGIKEEPDVTKTGHNMTQDLEIGSVFSLVEDSKPAPPSLSHMDLPASCSTCQNVLLDGATVYQRKAHTDLFCSTSCLLKFYQVKSVKKTCHFCLQAITKPQTVLQADVDNNGSKKDFCSQTCLSSFNYKRITASKIPVPPVTPHAQCSVCSRYCISKHEMILQGVVHKICSDPCFHRFCNINDLFLCENCGSRCNKLLRLKMEDGDKSLCSAECLSRFKQGNQTLQPCSMCRDSKLMSDMIESRNSEDVVELFCSKTCVMASKIQAICASGAPLSCNNCKQSTVPVCHLAMSDASIRNFCSLTCAMVFQETHKDLITNTDVDAAAAQNQTQADSDKPADKLPCAQCEEMIKTLPTVIQTKKQLIFVCSPACSQEFKRINNVTGTCERCRSKKIISEVKRVDNRTCYFCSDRCFALFLVDLERKLGKRCPPCSYCLSVSKTVVAAEDEGAEEKFCSEACRFKHKLLTNHLLRCDACGRRGSLTQSLTLQGSVRHFCDLKCFLHFCSEKDETLDSGSLNTKSTGTVESSPVITNVMSLSNLLTRHLNASKGSSDPGLFTDIQTKVVGHAGVQTDLKELKNKSMLCVPLVHNKGTSCSVQTVETGAQTVNFKEEGCQKVVPVPVPVFVPLPMNMYSQYTPTPLVLPAPLPVPVFLSEKLNGPDLTVKEKIQSESIEEDLSFSPEREDDKTEKKNAQEEDVTEEEERPQAPPPEENSSSRNQLETDRLQQTFTDQKNICDSLLNLFFQPQTLKISDPPGSDQKVPGDHLSDLPTPAPPLARPSPPAPAQVLMNNHGSSSKPPPPYASPAPSAPLAPAQVLMKNHESSSNPPPAPPPAPPAQALMKNHESSSNPPPPAPEPSHQTLIPREHKSLNSQCGVDAWRRWIQWRESQTNLGLPVSSPAATLKDDILECSSSELNDGLCLFIKEVKRPEGEPHPPDSIFYLCLCIQEYLLENGRMENIFSDLIYQRFSTEFTRILKGFGLSLSARGHIRSCVEEAFLWESKQLGVYSPIVLLNTLLFFCCKYLGLTAVEQHRRLSFARVVLCTKTNSNGTKTTFLRFYPASSTNQEEPDSDDVPAKKRKLKGNFLDMKENTKNPLHCPVRLYEFYLSKCSESVRHRSDLFYLQPDRRCTPSSPLWFSPKPLDDATMEAMIVRTLTVRELQEKSEGEASG